MGRRPFPPDLHVLRGNPSHKKLGPPPPPGTIPAEVPEAPEFLSPAARMEWDRLAPALHRRGLLALVDIGPFGAYCAAYGHWQAAEVALAATAEDDQAARRILAKAARTSCASMVLFAREFGLSPRTRVSAVPLSALKFDGLLA